MSAAEFGTGALKITPGHDPNDYAIAQRHNLPVISILDEAAKINENGGPYRGQDRFECRENLWSDMKKAGLVIKSEPYTTTIPRSQRGGEIVEPMISTQWFVKIEPLAKAALRGRSRWPYQDRAGSLREGLLQLAGEHQGLVHQPSAVVGTPHPCLVLSGRSHDDRTHRPNPVRYMWLGAAHPGSRRVGYVVFVRIMALLNPGMARRIARL